MEGVVSQQYNSHHGLLAISHLDRHYCGHNNWRSCSCALISFLKNLKNDRSHHLGLETARLGLARSLPLALDFEVSRQRYTNNNLGSFHQRLRC